MSLRLAPPPTARDAAVNEWLNELYIELTRMEGEYRKLQRDVELVHLKERLILSDAAGLRYSITVNAVGPALVATELP